MSNWIIHSEKRQWKDHEYEERVIEGEGVPSGFSIAESYEEDGNRVYIVETPSGDEHKFVGVPSKEEMNRWASNIKHSDDEDTIYVSREECLDYLKHHGILGQKWGIRRYQNPDGTLTPEGKARYGANFEKGIPKQTLKKALKDYNTRTGSNLKLKDARTIRVGQYLYDKNGRRVKEDVSAEVSDAYKKKQAQAAQKAHQAMQQQNQPKKQGAVGKFLADKGSKILNNIADAAIDTGKAYLTKQLREAVGLDKEEGPRSARTQAELLKKAKDSWTPQDYQFYESIRSSGAPRNARTEKELKAKPKDQWTSSDYQLNETITGTGNAKTIGDLMAKPVDEWTMSDVNFYNNYMGQGGKKKKKP